MSKVIWHIAMSVDGFIAGADDDMSWLEQDGVEPSPVEDEVASSLGAVLGGRRWYDVATARYDGRAGIYGGKFKGKVVVVTHDVPADPPDPEITFVTSGLREALDEAISAANGKNVAIFGANTAQQLVDLDLVDEIVIHVVPVLLGDGVRLNARGGPSRKLSRTYLGESGQSTDLRFEVSRNP